VSSYLNFTEHDIEQPSAKCKKNQVKCIPRSAGQHKKHAASQLHELLFSIKKILIKLIHSTPKSTRYKYLTRLLQ